MTPDAIKAALNDAQILGLTAWAEARSELVPRVGWREAPVQSRIDVMSVAMNRSRRRPGKYGRTVKAVCLQRWQFSCWEPTGGPDDPNDPDLLSENFEALIERAESLLNGKPPSAKLRECLFLARGMIAGEMVDSIAGAEHYYAVWMLKSPAWASGRTPVVERFGHRFFVGVP